MILKRVLYILIFLVSIAAKASFILLPMDENTTEFKSTLLVFVQNQLVTQLSGGSFLLPDAPDIRKECQIRGVSFEAFRW
jgi:hypothetical protein